MGTKELKRLIELFNNGGDLSDYAKAKLLTFIDEQQALQLLQTDVSSGSLLQTCNKCNSMIFNADGTKCIQCNENHY